MVRKITLAKRSLLKKNSELVQELLSPLRGPFSKDWEPQYYDARSPSIVEPVQPAILPLRPLVEANDIQVVYPNPPAVPPRIKIPPIKRDFAPKQTFHEYNNPYYRKVAFGDIDYFPILL